MVIVQEPSPGAEMPGRRCLVVDVRVSLDAK
jgi:hypothetical protein